MGIVKKLNFNSEDSVFLKYMLLSLLSWAFQEKNRVITRNIDRDTSNSSNLILPLKLFSGKFPEKSLKLTGVEPTSLSRVPCMGRRIACTHWLLHVHELDGTHSDQWRTCTCGNQLKGLNGKGRYTKHWESWTCGIYNYMVRKIASKIL